MLHNSLQPDRNESAKWNERATMAGNAGPSSHLPDISAHSTRSRFEVVVATCFTRCTLLSGLSIFTCLLTDCQYSQPYYICKSFTHYIPPDGSQYASSRVWKGLHYEVKMTHQMVPQGTASGA